MNALYIEGTNKLYRTFHSELDAIEHKNFLEVPDKNTPDLELGVASHSNRHLWSYRIHWDIVNGIKLNDFEAYDNLLFMEDERLLPDRWRKFIKLDYRGIAVGVYMPFSKPRYCNEFHLNHYVYWMVLNYLKIHFKIGDFYDYNTGSRMACPISFCWACQYHQVIYEKRKEQSSEIHYKCDFCPLWSTMYECENNEESPYSLWCDEEDTAEEIAKMPWSSFDYLVNGILY